jgi:hypothetical protein
MSKSPSRRPVVISYRDADFLQNSKYSYDSVITPFKGTANDVVFHNGIPPFFLPPMLSLSTNASYQPNFIGRICFRILLVMFDVQDENSPSIQSDNGILTFRI